MSVAERYGGARGINAESASLVGWDGGSTPQPFSSARFVDALIDDKYNQTGQLREEYGLLMPLPMILDRSTIHFS